MLRCKPVKLSYQLFEPKGGSDDRLSPLIFLHGVASSKEATWGDLPQSFADQTKRKAYNVDARNHGDSEHSDEFTCELNTEDLLHFMDEMNFPKAAIVGHSMGGITGIKAALRAPQSIEMLLVEEMFAKKIPQVIMDHNLKSLRFWREVEKLIPPELSKDDADDFITQYILQKTLPQNSPAYKRQNYLSYPLGKDSSGRYTFKVNLEVVIKTIKNADTMMAENHGIYEGPSCFLYGTKSLFQIEKEKHHILQHFPKAVFEPFETSTHFVHKVFPDQFVESAVKFIKQNEKPQTCL